MSDFLTAALSYASQGLHVFPLLPRSKKPYAGSNGFKDASTKKMQIRHWWKQTPDANLAIRTGEESGIFAFDLDPRNGGKKSLAKLEREHGELPRTVKAITGGGGFHYLFRWPGWRVKNGTSKIGPGLDVKGDGGYIVAAPSIHDKTAAEYEWELAPGDAPIADAPAWLLELIAAKGGTEKTERISLFSVLSVPSLDDAIRISQPEGAGQRYHCLFTFARALKAIPEYVDAALPALRPIVNQWFKAALPMIRTKEFDHTWADFSKMWPKVRFPIGTGAMAEVVERAKAASLPKWAKRYDSEPVRMLVKVCKELQRRSKNEPFFISSRAAGDAIGTSKSNAATFVQMLVSDGVLTIAQKWTARRATRYRFIAP